MTLLVVQQVLLLEGGIDMSQPSFRRKVLTIGWSSGLAVFLILATGVLLLPSTKSARISLDRMIEARKASSEEPMSEDVALWTSKSARIDLQTVVDSEREAADTTRERP